MAKKYSYSDYLAGKYRDTQASRYKTGLAESQIRYSKMIEEVRKAQQEAAAPISPEYRQVANIYRTGGQYGTGARKAIAQAGREGLAGTQAALASTGMASGSMAAGVRARYSRDIQSGLQQVEDVRYEKLGGALQAVGAAREARGIRVGQSYLTMAQLVGGYKEPTVGQYESQEQLEAGRYSYRRSLQSQRQEEALTLQRAQQSFQEAQDIYRTSQTSKRPLKYYPNTKTYTE